MAHLRYLLMEIHSPKKALLSSQGCQTRLCVTSRRRFIGKAGNDRRLANLMSNQSMKPTRSTALHFAQGRPTISLAFFWNPLRCVVSVFFTTPWISSRFPAYAPASASILFPAFRFAAERRYSLVRLRSLLVHQ